MNRTQLLQLGVPLGPALEAGFDFLTEFRLGGGPTDALADQIRAVLADPARFATDPLRASFAKALLASPTPRASPAPWHQWGDDLEPEAVAQMATACRLPVAVAGALMPDAHVGYGLPIGGVLAAENAVIPYAVGVDIACRMKMTVLDLPVSALDDRRETLRKALESETRFGVGASFKRRREHAVMDDDWRVSPVTAQYRDRAWAQLGTSGSGNHFVEFGTLTVTDASAGLPEGVYVALLSHSGSRGTGAAVCSHYSKRAVETRPELPDSLRRLAWLDLGTAEGQEYWHAMELMGRYAAANHACIHAHLTTHLGVETLLDVENHHNFAWRETHVVDGTARPLIVHRKGATPAGPDALGVIPGTMASPGYVVRGRGNRRSLHSASHGAGRRMSRTRAHATLNWAEANAYLRDRGVTLLSAGLDEVPFAYKSIETVMAAQADLVTPLARFDPRLVKMSPAGERPED